ncbi:unnamed protein product, partial [Echinostoma caproni]|uniref:SET domain-containing protein n=1 Tax=Echinostoma caproni TaxID=27848 RepID=A0A183B926_9TREM
FVNCARCEEEQNLVTIQYRGKIYYRACEDIQKNKELLTYYGSEDTGPWKIGVSKVMNFAMDLILEKDPSSCKDNGIDLLPGDKLSDLEYADDIVLLSENPAKLQSFLESFSASVAMFGMRFQPSKCKLLLRDWVGPAPQ